MAADTIALNIYDQKTLTVLSRYDGQSDSFTIGDIVNSVGFEVTDKKGGNILEHSLIVTSNASGQGYINVHTLDVISNFYALYKYVEPEVVESFFLDGVKYQLGGGDEAAWGNISGTLSDQTDLQTALNAKADKTEVLTKTNTTAFTPTGDYNPATKKYVDDNKTEYNAGQGISIGDVTMNARKGPSPEGFHVPAITEWQGVKTIMDSLSLTTGDSWRINLHIPFAGNRADSSADLINQGSDGNYWSSSPNDGKAAYYVTLSQYSVYAIYSTTRIGGSTVRCFKNSYEEPDSSWTVVQGTLGSSGIFWNQSEGLISITDGNTGYTMMDKNLGATTVYNDGDTLTQDNMGNMYQRGNNYGFPSTGTISKTSSTKVDASTYGPTNPYSNDTFIIGKGDWSSVHNDDLWGDTTGTITQENVISNTGVLSVNGQTGNVTIQTGGNYTAGTGIDITNDEIGLDGTYEGTIQDYSAMQGPAPDGFHVPLTTEWNNIYTIWTTLGGGASDGTNFGIALKLPFAGYRYLASANVGNQGSNGYYWSSSRNNTSRAYYLRLISTNLLPQEALNRAYGFSVRCFKDIPVIPTSFWTKLYGTSIEAGGIFWSSTDGLISLSSDGQTWITIADKNLGATTVWNSGDTLSEANCGKYYQWGNNYGFPHSGTVTTSSTKVDASNYGPGNYYSSDTFITVSSNPYRWDTTDNGNLWGGETGIQPITVSGNLVLGDKLYKIVTSTTAPASGTASNIITIVTD